MTRRVVGLIRFSNLITSTNFSQTPEKGLVFRLVTLKLVTFPNFSVQVLAFQLWPFPIRSQFNLVWYLTQKKDRQNLKEKGPKRRDGGPMLYWYLTNSKKNGRTKYKGKKVPKEETGRCYLDIWQIIKKKSRKKSKGKKVPKEETGADVILIFDK